MLLLATGLEQVPLHCIKIGRIAPKCAQQLVARAFGHVLESRAVAGLDAVNRFLQIVQLRARESGKRGHGCLGGRLVGAEPAQLTDRQPDLRDGGVVLREV